MSNSSSKNPPDDVSQMHIVTLDAPCSVCGSMVTLRVQSESEAQRLVGLLLCAACARSVRFRSLPRCSALRAAASQRARSEQWEAMRRPTLRQSLARNLFFTLPEALEPTRSKFS